MKLKTRVFEFCNGKYTNLSNLAQAVGISVSQIYRVRQGKRSVNEKFIVGVIKAFPGYRLDDLFYVVPDGTQNKPALSSKVMLTTTDVARLLGLHPNTVRRWNRKGMLKSYRINARGDRRFRCEDVDGFLKEREIE